MLDIKIYSGTLTFEVDRVLTLEDVSNLAKASMLVGVPGDAVITRFTVDIYGDRVRIDISWSLTETKRVITVDSSPA